MSKDTFIDIMLATILIALLIAIVILMPQIVDAAYKASTPLVKVME